VLYLVDVAKPALAQFLEDSVVAERLTDLKNGDLLRSHRRLLSSLSPEPQSFNKTNVLRRLGESPWIPFANTVEDG
jgi:hypothetical protein